MTVQNHYFLGARKLAIHTLLFFLVALLLLLPTLALTQQITITDQLLMDETLEENLTVTLAENMLSELHLALPPEASDVTLEGKAIRVTNDSLIIPLNCTNCQFTITYQLAGTIRNGPSGHEFSRTLNFPSTPQTLMYIVRLPPGHGLAPGAESAVPAPDSIETDGNSILLTWTWQEPALPERYYVAYQNNEMIAFTFDNFLDELTEWPIWIMIGLCLLLGAGAGILYERRHARQAPLFSAVPVNLLTPDEQALLQAVGSKSITQKELGKKLVWSKSKVSAVCTGLEYKQLLEREKHGRQRMVRLAKGLE